VARNDMTETERIRKVPVVRLRRSFKGCLARARPKRRTDPQGSRAHAEARANRWGNCLQRTAATGAEFQTGVGAGKVSAQPVASRGAFLIDALHGPAGQILHVASPSGHSRRCSAKRRAAEAAKMPDCDAGSQWCQEESTQGIGVGLPKCGFPVNRRRKIAVRAANTTGNTGLTDCHRQRVKFRSTIIRRA